MNGFNMIRSSSVSGFFLRLPFSAFSSAFFSFKKGKSCFNFNSLCPVVASANKRFLSSIVSKIAIIKDDDLFRKSDLKQNPKINFSSISHEIRPYSKIDDDEAPTIVEGEVKFKKVKFSEKYSYQYAKVKEILDQGKKFSSDIIETNASTFYNDLGLNEYYFETASPHTISNTLECIIATKILNEASNADFFPLIHQQTENGFFWIARASLLNRKASQNYLVEKELESKYLELNGLNDKSTWWRLQCYRSVSSIFDDAENYYERLRTYFLQKPSYPCEQVERNEEDLDKLLDVNFGKFKKGSATEEIFKNLNKTVVRDPTDQGLFINVVCRGDYEYRLDFAFRRGIHTGEFFSRLGDCVTMWGCYSQRKYLEALANGVVILSTFIHELPKNLLNSPHLTLEQRVQKMLKVIRMMYILPVTRFTELAEERRLTMHEVAYSYAVTKFITSFACTVGTAFPVIEKMVQKFGANQISQQELYDVRTRLKVPPYSEEAIFNAVASNTDIVKKLYREFQYLNHPLANKLREKEKTKNEKSNVIEEDKNSNFSLSFFFSSLEQENLTSDILSLDSPEAPPIFQFFRTFNNSILRTNFWKDPKLALSFRFDPSFLPESDYPTRPYSIFMSVGSSYLGYHVRFSDIARGGVRVVQSFLNQAYEINKKHAFDEIYKLAYTQHYKNKDIPEGGSKGLILLRKTASPEEAKNLTKLAFRAYIDSMLDLLLKNDRIADRLGKPEICFLGPDEHTGTDMHMDWAALYAKYRGAWFWKAFTTGKLPELGGIPHDLFGMTTTSVETYIKAMLEKHNLKEEEVTKFQTGGPDGDLGSNAILKSSAKILSIVDASGVLHDPEGLNKEELRRLASSRFQGKSKCVTDYDKKYLSQKGFIVPQDARNFTLPDGTEVKSGFKFRNEFHLMALSKADLFNPCGGRPASINPFNVKQLIDKETSLCRFKYIVEGANVFITDDARRMLEKHGAILFKDASTNKGGVTSSSFEVLAALALTDEEFEKHMQVKCMSNPPDFYKRYVESIIEKIQDNAKLEFEALWNEGNRTGIPRCDLTDTLSAKIINLKKEILNNDILWNDEVLVDIVLSAALPKVLVPELMPVKVLKKKVPDDYLKAIFASFLAARFYYSQEFSKDMSAFAFFNYIHSLKQNKKLIGE